MQITPKFKFVEGSFDTETNKMLCIVDDNHGTVELCFKEKDCGWNIPFAAIKIYDSGKYVDFAETMKDAQKLGNEIARRWNESNEKQ